MWLLSTDRAELHYFTNNYEATGGYAILSHTWTGDEQTLQAVRAIGERCRASGANPRDDPALSAKVRECCIIAERYGYRWVWIDSCCIDKTSSSELSEAINSMFRWYKEAEVCFAYLADVPSGCNLHAPRSAFRKSRWHTRGWTLQELIAPDFIVFLSGDWDELGNRADIAELLEEITRVPSKVLTGEEQPAEYSVGVRMSWASRRNTTRVEDEAYCLMGLFRVSMPTNYGEGTQAFIRLQYEIMQRNPDMSLFAFGACVNHPEDRGLTFYPEQVPSSNGRYILADSPREFRSGAMYIPDLGTNATQPYPPPLNDRESIDPFKGRVELPRAAATSYGVKLRVPVYEDDDITIALILCQRSRRHVGLFLTRDSGGKDQTRPRYFTGCSFTKPGMGSARFSARLADLGDDLHKLTFLGRKVEASWRTIYVVPTVSDFDTRNSTTPMLTINCNPVSPFRVPRWLVARFTALQFTLWQVRDMETLQVLEIFHDRVIRIYVSFGSCIQREDRSISPDNPRQLWAKVDVLSPHIMMHTFDHDCCKDHIDSKSWETRSKFFGDADREVRLSLMPSTRTLSDGSESFVIHLELLGHVLGEMFKGPGGVSMFPSLADLKRDSDAPRPFPNGSGITSSESQPLSPSHMPSIASASSRSTGTLHMRPSLPLVHPTQPSPNLRLLHPPDAAWGRMTTLPQPLSPPRMLSPPTTGIDSLQAGSRMYSFQPSPSHEYPPAGAGWGSPYLRGPPPWQGPWPRYFPPPAPPPQRHSPGRASGVLPPQPQGSWANTAW